MNFAPPQLAPRAAARFAPPRYGPAKEHTNYTVNMNSYQYHYKDTHKHDYTVSKVISELILCQRGYSIES